MQKAKIDEALRKKLFSTSNETVVSAVHTIKETGNKDYLPLLFDVLMATSAPEIEKELVDLLATVKDKEAIPLFISALKDNKYKNIRKQLVAACWQNGLDYSLNMEVFIDLIVEEEWEVAFEAFTVIENFEHFPPEEQFNALKLKIAGALRKVNEQKQYFLEEILKMSAE